MAKKPKRKALKKPGKCIFFGEDHTTPLHLQMSKEHLFGDWMNKLIRPYGKTINYRDEIGKKDGIGGVKANPQFVITGRAIIQKQLRCVCVACNTGWMRSEVEERARPILTSMIKGECFNFDSENQKILATWIALKSMIFDWEYYSAVTQNERDWMRDNRTPPANWIISVGKRQPIEPLLRFTHYGMIGKLLPGFEGKNPAEAELNNTQATTIFIGEMLFNALSSRSDNIVNCYRAICDAEFPVNRLWPNPIPTVFSWPAWATIGPEGAETIANGFIAALSGSMMGRKKDSL